MNTRETASAQRCGLLSKPGAASYLSICTRSVDNLMKDGSLPYVKLGRRVLFRQADLDRLIEARIAIGGTRGLP